MPSFDNLSKKVGITKFKGWLKKAKLLSGVLISAISEAGNSNLFNPATGICLSSAKIPYQNIKFSGPNTTKLARSFSYPLSLINFWNTGSFSIS